MCAGEKRFAKKIFSDMQLNFEFVFLILLDDFLSHYDKIEHK